LPEDACFPATGKREYLFSLWSFTQAFGHDVRLGSHPPATCNAQAFVLHRTVCGCASLGGEILFDY
jgi:hypothetical protein